MLSIVLGVIVGALIYYIIIKPANFWKERNITHVKGWPLIGNMSSFVMQKKHFSEIHGEIYKKYPNDRYVGYMQFTTPVLLIKDIDIIKQIGVKEFDSFHDHLPAATSDIEPLLGKSLINLLGDRWKKMRATLSPVFTSSKIKNMYTLIYECAEKLPKHFQGKEQVEVEMKDVFTRFTNDVIATVAFGIQINSLKEPHNEFYTMGKNLTTFNLFQICKLFFAQSLPELAKLLKITFIPQNVTNFFRSIITNNMKKREEEGIIRPDLIHLLMEARKGKLKHDDIQDSKDGFATVEESKIGKSTKRLELDEEDIVAQSLLFFFAGFETVSTGLCFMAYELVVNPEVQKRLQEEIDSVSQQYEGKVSYEVLQSMKYLDQVVCETLRLWPPALQTDRLCNKDYIIKPTSPKEKTFVLEKGMMVMIPIKEIHCDSRYFPNPSKFDPERFNDENKSKILPGSYIPFGVGPRNCIGSRLALLEIKTLYFHLLSAFDIVPTDKTEIPIKIDPKRTTSIAPRNGFQLALRPRKKSC